MMGLGAAIGTALGAIHLAGWNLEFPSTADKWLWRSSAIVTTAVPGLMALHTPFLLALADLTSGDTIWSFLDFILIFVGSVLYIVGRGILIVEMIRTL